MTLTAKKVRDTKPANRNRIIWDDTIKGLGLRVTKGGARSFVLSYRADGRKRLMTLARVSEISLEDARKLAGDHLVRVRQGADGAGRLRLHCMAHGITALVGHIVAGTPDARAGKAPPAHSGRRRRRFWRRFPRFTTSFRSDGSRRP
ncbi:MAG: DUF4102 domain-containing protein [Silicimonas sp.]|nr:DUF4102 domain-containing protein [Silicimonas sp.]